MKKIILLLIIYSSMFIANSYSTIKTNSDISHYSPYETELYLFSKALSEENIEIITKKLNNIEFRDKLINYNNGISVIRIILFAAEKSHLRIFEEFLSYKDIQKVFITYFFGLHTIWILKKAAETGSLFMIEKLLNNIPYSGKELKYVSHFSKTKKIKKMLLEESALMLEREMDLSFNIDKENYIEENFACNSNHFIPVRALWNAAVFGNLNTVKKLLNNYFFYSDVEILTILAYVEMSIKKLILDLKKNLPFNDYYWASNNDPSIVNNDLLELKEIKKILTAKIVKIQTS